MAEKGLHERVYSMDSSEYRPSTKPTKVVQGVASRWWTSLIHFVPIGLSGFLLYLSYSCWYWFPETRLNAGVFTAEAKNVLNWLQLAAKLYEIVVVASMAAITLKAYKRAFVDTGIPFGLLSGPYRVGDILYLVSSTFWRGLGYVSWREPSHVSWRDIKIMLLAAMVAVTTLLSQLVGPASAILIIPELGWFPLPNAFSQTTMPIFYYAAPAGMWPTTIDDNLWFIDNDTIPACRLERATFLYPCPAGGFADIYTWASGWEFSNLPNNITFQDPSGSVSRRLDMQNNTELGTFITTPTAMTAKTMGQFRSYIRSKNVGAVSHTEKWKLSYTKESVNYQPLVQAKCNIWNTDSSDKAALKNMSFPYKELNCYNEPPGGDCQQIRDHISDWTINNDFTQIKDNVTYWLGTTNAAANSSATDPSTLIFAASLPYYSGGVIKGVRVVGCSYMAHWVPSTPIIDPSNTDYITTNITKLDVFFTNDTTNLGKKKKATVGPVINLDSTWLPYLDVSQADDEARNFTDEGQAVGARKADISYSIGSLIFSMTMTNTTGTNDVFGPGSDFQGSTGDDKVQLVIEKLTGSIVADAIARTIDAPAYLIVGEKKQNKDHVTLDQLFVQEGPNSYDMRLYQNGTLFVPDQKPTVDFYPGWNNVDELITNVKKDFVTVDFKAEQYGYGFGEPGPPMRFALTVIITYLAMLLFYWFVTLVTQGKTVAPWDDLQDLIALAWTSPPPPELKGQGAKVVDKQLWKETVSVRARDTNVSLVLGDEKLVMDKLRKGVEYY